MKNFPAATPYNKSRSDLQAFGRGRVCVSCCITTGSLTVIEYHLYLKDRTIAKTSLCGAYDAVLFSFYLLPSHFHLKAHSHKPP